jgi:hypothetical protein
LIVTIICIAMIVMGGVILSQGLLTSADNAALSIEDITIREGDLARTALLATGAADLTWSGLLRVTVRNSGQTGLAGFDRWDVIVDYVDAAGTRHCRRLPFTEGELAGNQWRKARIGLDGPVEFFEPDILNPQEELVVLASLDPPSGGGTAAKVTIAAVNGIGDSMAFDVPDYLLLTPHAENTTIAATPYYQLQEDNPADGAGAVMSAEYDQDELGRKILCDESLPSQEARYIFPLVGIEQIPSANWTVYYQCRTLGVGEFPEQDGDTVFDVDILIRRADGGIRATVASGVAGAVFPAASQGEWITISGTFNFPDYSVVDENDYLEVVYYGRVVRQGPKDGPGSMQLAVDDGTLPPTEQTRIES